MAGRVLRCGKPATHVCFVECIGEDGPQSKTERRCDTHSDDSETRDIIDKWTLAEWEAMD